MRVAKTQLRLLERHQKDIGIFNDEILEKASTLARSISTLTAEVRKREAHDHEMVSRMSPAEKDRLVMEYLKGLPRDRRAGVRALLDEIDDAEQIL